MHTDAGRSSDSAPSAAPAPPSSGGSTKALVGALLAGTVGMIIFLFVHLSKDGQIRSGPASAHAGCVKGQRDCLPEADYVDTTGVAYSHASLAGKIVLVNFWATWCAPCKKEIPDLSRVYEKYKAKGVVFLGVLIDNPDNQQLLNFQSDHEMAYPVVRATPDVMAAYNHPDQYPTTFIYDRRGKQVLSRIGMVRERELDTLIATLAAQN